MRIALVGIGASPHVTRLAESLARRGHAVHVVSEQRHGPFPELAGVLFHGYDHALPFFRRMAAVRGILRAVAPDVVNSHYVNIGGFVAVASGFHPHVMTAWGSDIYQAARYSRAQLLKTAVALRAADWVLSPSATLQREMDRIAHGIRNSTLWQWGVDTALFKPHPPGDARREFGLPDGPLAYSPRALQPLYNQDRLVEAWPAVRREIPTARLLIKRLLPDADFERKLRARAEALGVSDALVWEEPAPYAELPARYSAPDVIVSIPSTDGAPVSVLEAMACGKPVIACDVPALREWITPGVHGWLVDPHDPAAIAAAVVRALRQSPAERAPMQTAARSQIIERADKERHLIALESLFTRLAGRPRVSALSTLSNVLGMKQRT